MPIEAQTRLLRVLQDGDYTPVGAARSVRADVRIVAATNQNLAELVSAGRFREDLYYRLNVIPLSLPPLRDRRSDVPLLARHFLAQAAASGLPPKHLSAAAAELLGEWHWPGNVRELGNVIQRLMLLTRSDQIESDDVVNVLRLLPDAAAMAVHALPAGNADVELERAVRRWLRSSVADAAAREQELFGALIGRVERLAIEHAMERTTGNQLRAAALLGINRNTLRQKRAP
jgi:two-component system, NtrC family, nitrogen regulation response regulator GlnG